MANENGKFKILIESDGEKMKMECRGRKLDIYAAISRFLADSTKDDPDEVMKAIIYSVCDTALQIVALDKNKEDMSFEEFIAEIFKNKKL